jgi:hypothetical protein
VTLFKACLLMLAPMLAACCTWQAALLFARDAPSELVLHDCTQLDRPAMVQLVKEVATRRWGGEGRGSDRQGSGPVRGRGSNDESSQC